MKFQSHLNKIRFNTKNINFWSNFLLLLGTATLVIASYRFFLDIRQTVGVNRNIEIIQNQLDLSKPATFTTDNPEQLEIINKIKNQHRYPWSELFAALEAVHSREPHLFPPKEKQLVESGR